ncbi:ankyrin, partial [Ascobolus immersus RN42]
MGRTALHKACQRGKLEDAQRAYEMKPLLLNQADNAGYVPLHEAALNGKANCVKYLLEVGCKVDPLGGQDKDTPLMDAVENRHVDVVELLLEAGADPRLRDVKGRNAMDL